MADAAGPAVPAGHRIGALDARVRLCAAADDLRVGDILVEGYVTAYAKKMPEVAVGAERRDTLRDVAAKRAAAFVLVIEQGRAVAGTVALWAPGAPGSEAWRPNACDLRHLAVHPDCFGQGLSKPLLDETEALARALGARSVCLHVRRGNEGVKRLYEARGYVREPRGDLDYPDVSLVALALDL